MLAGCHSSVAEHLCVEQAGLSSIPGGEKYIFNSALYKKACERREYVYKKFSFSEQVQLSSLNSNTSTVAMYLLSQFPLTFVVGKVAEDKIHCLSRKKIFYSKISHHFLEHFNFKNYINEAPKVWTLNAIKHYVAITIL